MPAPSPVRRRRAALLVIATLLVASARAPAIAETAPPLPAPAARTTTDPPATERDERPPADADADARAGVGGPAGETRAAGDAPLDTERLCDLLVGAADAHGVPRDFFIRLVWAESRFDPGAVSPVGAEGIAQFMPYTARERGLADPFDPVEALPASAAFLAELAGRFGNWGLAAAGYNGGPNRVAGFVADGGVLPYETVAYVFAITGRTAEHWRARARAAGEAAETADPAARRSGIAGGAAADRPGASGRAATERPSSMPASDPAGAGRGDPPGGVLAARIGGRTMPAPAAVAGARGALPGAPLGPPPLAPAAVAAGRLAAAAPVAAPRRVAVRVPRPRPRGLAPPVDCPRLVARLGRARTTPRPGDGRAAGAFPWGAQVAGHVRRAIALSRFGRLAGRLPADLAGRAPSVVLRRFPARGRRPLHAVQFGVSSRAEAAATCERIAAAGVACVVTRNR